MTPPRRVVIASDANLFIRSSRDVTDAVGACLGGEGLVLTPTDLAPEFFDLRTGLAGELFQKLVNYGVRTAIVLPDPSAPGERFSELAREHRSHPLIRFFPSREDAAAWLEVVPRS